MNDFPIRKPNRLQEFDYSEKRAYFVTICTKNKEKLLSTILPVADSFGNKIVLTDTGKTVNQSILNISEHYPNVCVDKSVVMPNHVHILFRIVEQDGRMISAPTIIGSMKKFVSKTLGKQIWQKGFYDHVIRDENDYLSIWKYIDDNPHKWNVDEYFV